MLQVPVSDAFSFHKPQRDLKACPEETNWIGKTFDQSEAKDGSEDATSSRRFFSASFGSPKSPPTWMDRTHRFCGTVARLLGMLTVMLFAAFLIYMNFSVSQRSASVGARVEFSFVRCWPTGHQIYSRCPFQIALSFDAVGGIKFNNIIANPVVENMTVPASGQWEGEYFVGIQFQNVDAALKFEKALLAISQEDLLKQARKNFLAAGYPVSGMARMIVRRVCTSSDVIAASLPDTESIGVESQQESASQFRVNVPRCMYDL